MIFETNLDLKKWYDEMKSIDKVILRRKLSDDNGSACFENSKS